MQGNLIWITGLAGSGKTTIGKGVYNRLKKENLNTVFLDGDHFREITGQVSAHTKEARLDVAFQIARMCKFLTEQGINVVCSTISLFKEVHDFNRNNNPRYYEVYIHCEMGELIRRDQKNLYSRAIAKEIENVVGIDIPFDKPLHCNLEIDNTRQDNLNEKINLIINLIKQ